MTCPLVTLTICTLPSKQVTDSSVPMSRGKRFYIKYWWGNWPITKRIKQIAHIYLCQHLQPYELNASALFQYQLTDHVSKAQEPGNCQVSMTLLVCCSTCPQVQPRNEIDSYFDFNQTSIS